jgi:hypothetical protein
VLTNEVDDDDSNGDFRESQIIEGKDVNKSIIQLENPTK